MNSAHTRTDAGELDEEALADVEQTEGKLRALGLVSGDVDLVESGNDLTDTGTLAFYDPTTERLDVVGDDEADTAELRAALDAWAAVAPAGSAIVSQLDDRVRLEACDPGIDAVVATGSAIGALTVLATHSFVLAEALGQGAPTTFAACYARAVATTFTPEEFGGEATPADFDARLVAAADSRR